MFSYTLLWHFRTYVFPDFYSKKPPDVPPVTSPRTVQPPPPQPSDIDAATGLHRRKEDDLAENKNGGEVAAEEALDAADDAEDAGDAADDVAEGNLQGRGKEADVEVEPIDANSGKGREVLCKKVDRTTEPFIVVIGDALKGDELSKAADDILMEQVPFLGAHESTPKKGIGERASHANRVPQIECFDLKINFLSIYRRQLRHGGTHGRRRPGRAAPFLPGDCSRSLLQANTAAEGEGRSRGRRGTTEWRSRKVKNRRQLEQCRSRRPSSSLRK